MKKRWIITAAGLLCVVNMAVGAAAGSVIQDIRAQLRPDFTIEIDGEVKHFKNAQGESVYPILYDGTTYLPIRAIGEIMDKTVYWYEDAKRIELKNTTVTDADVIIGGADVQTDIKVTNDAKAQKDNIDTTAFIGEEKAKEIALEKAGLTVADVIFDRTELDKDDGVWHYEVEFRQGRTEYDTDIKADDGTILKWEVDLD